MTYIGAVILAFCILAVVEYLFRNVVHRGEIVHYVVLFALGSIGYAFAMMVMYMFGFSEAEMSGLASYERYMSTYVVSEYVVLLLLAWKLIDRKQENIYSCHLVCGMLGIGLLLLGKEGLPKLMPLAFEEKGVVTYRDQAESIQENVPEGTNVFLISDHNDVDTFFISYYLDDRRIDERYISSNVSTWGAENTEYWNDVMNCIREDGYLYVSVTSDNVQEILGRYTMNGEVTDETLYVVNEENGEMKLENVW